jgi:hypothetical protein
VIKWWDVQEKCTQNPSIYQVQAQKVNAKCPDFKYRKTQYTTLWLGDQQKPPWIEQSWWHGSWVCRIGHIFMDQ